MYRSWSIKDIYSGSITLSLTTKPVSTNTSFIILYYPRFEHISSTLVYFIKNNDNIIYSIISFIHSNRKASIKNKEKGKY